MHRILAHVALFVGVAAVGLPETEPAKRLESITVDVQEWTVRWVVSHGTALKGKPESYRPDKMFEYLIEP
jgi:hypothetical protein